MAPRATSGRVAQAVLAGIGARLRQPLARATDPLARDLRGLSGCPSQPSGASATEALLCFRLGRSAGRAEVHRWAVLTRPPASGDPFHLRPKL